MHCWSLSFILYRTKCLIFSFVLIRELSAFGDEKESKLSNKKQRKQHQPKGTERLPSLVAETDPADGKLQDELEAKPKRKKRRLNAEQRFTQKDKDKRTVFVGNLPNESTKKVPLF